MTVTALRTRHALGFVLVAAILAVAMPSVLSSVTTTGGGAVDVDPALSSITSGNVELIVRARPGAEREVARALMRSGGVVTQDLPIVDGFAARVPASELAELARVAGVYTLTLNRKVRIAEGGSGSADSVYRKVVRADDVYDAGYSGQGVTVAVIDTGISEVADLAGRILPVQDDGFSAGTSPCKNFSGEPTCADSYGHGTFLAGIIAGNGAASGGEWKGIAPEAKLLSVKIAGASGSADVSTLLAAIQWVVSFKDTYNVKVLNLSLGTNGTQSYRTDPMNYAVQEAWEAGIVVVVAGSNLGPEPGTISKPGDDPWVITVGATDDRGTPGLGDDHLPDFSARGPTAADGLAKPDIVAPGAHIVSLRSPGSAVDTQFPNYIDGSYRKGSGTSMSTAAVSGIAALMLQRNPSWSPNRVKYALAATARGVQNDDPMEVGAGVANAYDATFAAPSGTANDGLDRSSGMGSLDASRGDVQVQADDGTVVSGILTLQLLLWDPILYTGTPWNSVTWTLSQWYGSSWHGSSWHGSSWGSSWHGDSFYGSSWHGGAWYGAWE